MINGAQLRAARALLGWSQDELATRAGVAQKTIARAEGDELLGGRTLQAITDALAEAGISFVESDDGIGVMSRRHSNEAAAARPARK